MKLMAHILLVIGNLLMLPSLVRAEEVASVEGQFVWVGNLPGSHRSNSLQIDPRTKGVKNVIVYLHSGETANQVAGEKVTIELSAKRGYDPRIVALIPADTLAIKVVDDGAPSTPEESEQGRTHLANANTGTFDYSFPDVKRIPYFLFCARNESAVCYVLVQEHRHVAITDSDGKFKISGLKPGVLKFRVWHETKGFINAWNEPARGVFSVDCSTDKSANMGTIELNDTLLRVSGAQCE